jgi:hypothetical protein
MKNILTAEDRKLFFSLKNLITTKFSLIRDSSGSSRLEISKIIKFLESEKVKKLNRIEKCADKCFCLSKERYLDKPPSLQSWTALETNNYPQT